MALAANVRDRFSRLLAAQVAERVKQFPQELRALNAMASAKGMLKSSAHYSQIQRAHERELEVRTTLAWQQLVRAYDTCGAPDTDSLGNSLKEVMHERINAFSGELKESVAQHARTLPSHMRMPDTLDELRQHLIRKHDLEIEIFEDSQMSRRNSKEAHPTNYNFYGAVGAVQTGANAQANVVQNLAAADKSALADALQLAQTAIQEARELDANKQKELVSIAAECGTELTAESPNNTKLLTMLNVLATSIQTVASAQPAYQALKLALLPLGVTLP